MSTITSWFSLVTIIRTNSDDILRSTHGRFHDVSQDGPTTYLADRPETAILEVQGWLGVPMNPKGFELYRVLVETNEAFREVSDSALLTDPASERCREEARQARESGDLGLKYPSTRNRPDGACLALFLEHRGQRLKVSIERGPRTEWEFLIG